MPEDRGAKPGEEPGLPRETADEPPLTDADLAGLDDAAEAEFEAELAEELEDEDAAEEEAVATTVESLGLPMPVLPEEEALALLAGGELELIGRLWVSSNNALLGVVRGGGVEAAVIHKPVVGERPLADFPDGTLARREVAAFAVSQATGWRIVPPTVLRDGPLGEGMLQLWIRTDPDIDPVDLVNGSDARLRRIAAFDAAVNNTDRKAGHLLPVPGGVGVLDTLLAAGELLDGASIVPAIGRDNGGPEHPHGETKPALRGAPCRPRLARRMSGHLGGMIRCPSHSYDQGCRGYDLPGHVGRQARPRGSYSLCEILLG